MVRLAILRKDPERVLKKRSFSKKDFDAIYAAMYERVLNFVRSRVSSKELAEDLTSEIFEKVYNSIDDFQWQGINIQAWIFRIARNRIIDYYRKNSKRKNDKSIYDVSNFIESKDKKEDEILLEQEEYKYLYDSIREFNEEDQYLIYYKFFEELSNKEIAELMKITESNVGTKLHRVRKKLGESIQRLSK